MLADRSTGGILQMTRAGLAAAVARRPTPDEENLEAHTQIPTANAVEKRKGQGAQNLHITLFAGNSERQSLVRFTVQWLPYSLQRS
ncbi:hypothetical protein EVAR_78308_1 [Eumeta japonica]|uniref:Uncharacterized protein n=1 Tax=Eumeta variegata TaxID=151549 RepID=A0A4C1T346_EUMVA|nr:hypothetical protein EVAR_78308_1 [Eumeta japonica]